MSKRDSYEKMSIEEFTSELEDAVKVFSVNMKNLNATDTSFPEWYETFAAWLEVGNDEEEMYYHRTDFCSNKDCKFC